MENIVWIIIMLPCSLLFLGIGIYALKCKKPVSFWSGTTVSPDEISDVRSYNRANGIMWFLFSLPFFASTVFGFFYIKAGAIILIAVCVIGIPVLPIVYGRIYKRYKK